MDPLAQKEKSNLKEAIGRVEKAKQNSAQPELRQRQRAEDSGLHRATGELEQQPFDECWKQMQPLGE
ncbi:small vasohibin-binding protein [Echinops telfairi]|uniref:Small vasohibin-binding protein n=1 Tax=Echinops telfairi TaxID=9371 RepID=A0ABM0ILG4_ECHTE|nr:small vasohibin-binding protein [Echinops telfairi]